jgi:ABC-type phosphate transport system substrate-binding protein
MIKLSRLLVGVASLAAAATLIAGTVTTASAAPKDPPKGVTPAYYDLVGVGSDTTQYVMDQITTLFNATVKVHNPSHPKFYSWDAVPPGVNKPGTFMITPKAGCKTMVRANGSSSGITALNTAQVIKVGGKFYPCVNFARSSRARKATDPKAAPGGIEFVAFARDAISWAVRSSAKGGNDAPKSLNLAQLKAIFTCADTNWSQVGGKNATIKVYLPQAGSGTLATWETFMGITTLGSCVSQAPEENEGTYSGKTATDPTNGFNSPNAIFIYSIGAYIAQKYHSAACGAKPSKTQNAFGCNVTGFLTPMDINGISPLSSAKVPVTNPAFPSNFWRVLYNVVPYTPGTANHMTLAINAIFGHTGYLCTSKVAKAQISNYGFVNTGLCGSVS